ncbi:MAG TPA: hypothetical protein VNW97_09445 [Candidatus Saccharimonadales bacterium]|nr:hypothetical protein [Candidatus Saccharimonadales bacterium]
MAVSIATLGLADKITEGPVECGKWLFVHRPNGNSVKERRPAGHGILTAEM